MTLGECMQSVIVSDYFINEYFLIHKEYTYADLHDQFISRCSSIFNYTFKNNKLLFEAFTHKSFAHEVKVKINNNEKLEFLGDSVLQLVISDALIQKFEMLDEGSLSKLRSAIVNESTLAKIGHFYKLGNHILVGKGELKTKGFLRESLISDCFEAIIGAIYLDSNYENAKRVLLGLVDKYEKNTNDLIIDQSIILDFDAKSKLQEIVMAKFKQTPKYISEQVENDEFEVSIFIDEKKIGTTRNKSKKKAMQILAKNILKNNEIARL